MHKFILLLVSVLSLFTFGCITTGDSSFLATTTQIVVKDGTYLYVSAHPETRPLFEAAAVSLDVLSKAEVVNFATALEIFKGLPFAKIENPVATLIISDVGLLLTHANVSVPIGEIENLRPLIVAMRDGIQMGLSLKSKPEGCRVTLKSGVVLN
jgi:hypothetical protein